MNKKNTSLILLVVLIVRISFAQEKADSSYKRLSKFPVLSVNYINYGNSDFDTDVGKGKIEMDEWSAIFQYVLPLKEKKWYIFNNLHYTYFTY